MKHPATHCRRQSGQAYVEYIVVTAVLIFCLVSGGGILIDPNNGSAISQLAISFKSFFAAYSFTLSLP